MMDKQVEPMGEQPYDMGEQPEQPYDQRDRQDNVSGDTVRDAAPGVERAPQDMPPRYPPMETPVDSWNQRDQVAARAQWPQGNGIAADLAAPPPPPPGSRPGPDGPSVEAGAVRPGDARPGPDATPTRPAGRQGPGDARPVPLLSADVAGGFRARWDTMQAAFVDEPRGVVEQADSLVAEVMQRIAETMAQERTGLERQWAAGDAVDTEDLRLALQRYRAFFQRLLSA